MNDGATRSTNFPLLFAIAFNFAVQDYLTESPFSFCIFNLVLVTGMNTGVGRRNKLSIFFSISFLGTISLRAHFRFCIFNLVFVPDMNAEATYSNNIHFFSFYLTTQGNITDSPSFSVSKLVTVAEMHAEATSSHPQLPNSLILFTLFLHITDKLGAFFVCILNFVLCLFLCNLIIIRDVTGQGDGGKHWGDAHFKLSLSK